MTENGAAEISRVAVKIPEFIAHEPELWFAMVERSFQAAGVTLEETKFGHVTGALPAKFAIEVKDVILSPPVTGAYTKLKSELIRRLSASQEEKSRRLLEREEIGDRKPSQFLRHLQGLADTTFPEGLMKSLWMSRLPRTVQTALTIVKDHSLEDLATHADNLMACDQPLPRQVAETTSLEAMFNLKMAQLTLGVNQQIEALRAELMKDRRDHSQNHSRERPQPATKP